MMSMMPVQKTGRLTPVTATPMLRRSSQEYCFTADTMPATRPSTTAMTRAPAVRRRVALKAEQHLGQHGAAKRDGAAEIAPRDLPDPGDVLDDERLIEAQVSVEALHVLLGRLGSEHDGRRIPRGQVQDGEDEHRDPEKDGDGEEQTAEGVGGKPAAPYCSHTCDSTRSKFGWSLKPCTRFRWMMICRPWSMKIHGASSAMMRWASL